MTFDQLKTRSLRPYMKAAAVLIILTLLAGLLPLSSAGAVTCKFKHKVKQGETLTYIANLYGVGWEKVADANQLNPPYTLIEAQVLCIPEGEKPSNSETDDTKDDGKKNPSLQVVPGLTKVLVSVENFSAKTSYFVRVTPAGGGATLKIGFFTTNKEGDYTGWFRLPPFVGRTPKMTVCVKNAWTDAISCAKYDDIYVNLPFIRGRCAAKVGR